MLLGLGGEGVGLLLGVVLDEPPPPHATNNPRTVKTTITSRACFLALAFRMTSLTSTIAGKSKQKANSDGCANGERLNKAVAPVVLTLTLTDGRPDEVANTVAGENEQVLPMGRFAHEKENVWFSAAPVGAKLRSSDAVCPAATEVLC